MSYPTLDEAQIKDLFKQAVLELVQEHRDLLYGFLVEVIEDIAMVNAIREGESIEAVNRAEALRLLQGAECESSSKAVSSKTSREFKTAT